VHHLILPASSLALFYAAIYTRVMRASMLEVAGQDFVRTARAKGIAERRVLYGHTLRNALLPLVTIVGVQVGSVLGGSVLVESVFGWPGLGRLAFEAVQQRDYNVLLGILLLSSLLVILVNLAIDLLYAVLDPRIELG
jgi:peptide/nickel transport system permease protein